MKVSVWRTMELRFGATVQKDLVVTVVKSIFFSVQRTLASMEVLVLKVTALKQTVTV